MDKLFRGSILGAPASGKGTISELIVKNFDVVHLSSGNILRQKVSEELRESKQFQKVMTNGKLLPDSVVTKAVLEKLKEVENKNWLLDGFPRTLAQAEELFKVYPLDLVINLNVPVEVIIERTSTRWIHESSGRVYNTEFRPPKNPGKDDETGEPLIQRPDDKPEAVVKRLKVHANTIRPLVEFYSSKGILREFYGKTSKEIWPHVHKTLSEIMKPKKC